MNWGPYHPMLSMESKCPIRSAWNPQARPRPQQSVCTDAFNPLENLMWCDFLITLILEVGGLRHSTKFALPASLLFLKQGTEIHTVCVHTACTQMPLP